MNSHLNSGLTIYSKFRLFDLVLLAFANTLSFKYSIWSQAQDFLIQFFIAELSVLNFELITLKVEGI